MVGKISDMFKITSKSTHEKAVEYTRILNERIWSCKLEIKYIDPLGNEEIIVDTVENHIVTMAVKQLSYGQCMFVILSYVKEDRW